MVCFPALRCRRIGIHVGVGSFSVSVLLTPEQLQQGLTFQPFLVQLAVFAIFLTTDAFLMWIFTLLMNRYKNRFFGKEWLLYLSFPISQYVLMWG